MELTNSTIVRVGIDGLKFRGTSGAHGGQLFETQRIERLVPTVTLIADDTFAM